MAASPNERRKPKAPKLYRVGLDFRIHTPPGLEMENFTALGVGRVLLSPRGKRSFPPLAETPRLLIDKSLGRPPVDWELRADFQHLRRWRKSVEQAQSYTFKAVITVLATGLMGAVWLGVKVVLGK
ncbi:hypothetical protein [Bradyrhizobium sp.]|jgi:hypothetical protein|uniref:hypothetical protein n=1 Tax=Bradyrhizobium sp. TaxID=376 RepID=UPI002DDCA875|nr:hypothetical protein [Bradyrhizobium sp.]HEV2154765.1 hypothetical protein [Bradyrhizobium sp.]